jgi:hypothetical protein
MESQLMIRLEFEDLEHDVGMGIKLAALGPYGVIVGVMWYHIDTRSNRPTAFSK